MGQRHLSQRSSGPAIRARLLDGIGQWLALGPGLLGRRATAPGQQGPTVPPQYVPQPPAPRETGPSPPGPDDSIYGPGYWFYQNQDFVWRPGGFYKGVPGWMWMPPHYVWTPNGYLLVPGYWDYPLENRGLLFAPVAFSAPLWLDPGWSYTPFYTINTGLLLDNLFCCGPGFWFGNCYGPYYAGRGFRPWHARNGPYLAYYRWANRGDPQWFAGLQRNSLARANGTMPAPSRADLIVPLNRVANVNRLGSAQINAHRAAAVRTHNLARQRQHNEIKTNQANPGRVNSALVNPGVANANKGVANANKGLANGNKGLANPGQAAAIQPVRPAVNSAPRIVAPAGSQNHPTNKTSSTTVRNTAAHPAHTAAAHRPPAVHHAPAANHRPASRGRAPAHSSGHKR